MEAIIKNTISGNLKDICNVAVVASNNPDAAGIAIAASLGIPSIVIESRNKAREDYEVEVLEELKKYSIDYIILAGFNRILSPYIVSKFRSRIINIHPADTRVFKGLHGYEWAFQNQLPRTTITVHYVDEGMDTGAIIAQKEVDLQGCHNLAEVTERGLKVENSFFSEALASLFSNC